jgi:hypothetical protein
MATMVYTSFSLMMVMLCVPTSGRRRWPITRFLESLREATSDLSSSTHYAAARETEFTNLAKAETLKLWLDTITTELGAIRLLLPDDTPVFTCAFSSYWLHVSDYQSAAMDPAQGPVL